MLIQGPRPPARSAVLLVFLSAAALPAAGEDEGADTPFFTNVSVSAGLAEHAAQRVAFADVDGDGFLDVVLGCLWKEKTTVLLRNVPGEDGRTFTDFTAAARIAAELKGEGRRAANVLIFADVDNDSDLDAFSGVYGDFLNPDFDGDRDVLNAVLLNDGNGVFRAAGSSGVEELTATTCAASFFDYDNDGRIDLFVGNWYKQYGASLDSCRDRLFKGSGKGRFKDVTEKAGLKTIDAAGRRTSSRPVYGAGHCDYNNDGFQDILVCAYGRQWNVLWQNSGKGTFEDAAERTGFDGDAVTHGKYPESTKEYFRKQRGVDREDEPPFRSNGNTFSVAAADFDCDGDVDLFLGEITHSWAGESSDRSSLLVNTGAEGGYAFERRADAVPRSHANPSNWNQGDMHVAWIDFDNDGLQDLLLSAGDYPDGQYLRLFAQRDDHTFEDVTARCGFDWEGSSGISLGDFDRDGDVDILAGKSWMRLPAERRSGERPAPALFRNDAGNGNNWITIQLKGRGAGGANRLGVGARILVAAGGRTQMREIQGGCGHSGQFNPPEAHFGIGPAPVIDRITVRWPNKRLSTQTFENVAVNRLVRITEGGSLDAIAPAGAKAAPR